MPTPIDCSVSFPIRPSWVAGLVIASFWSLPLSPSIAQSGPDSTRMARRAQILKKMVERRKPFHADGTGADCGVVIGRAIGLLAAMELLSQKIDTTIDASQFGAEAGVMADFVATTLTPLPGSGLGRCSFGYRYPETGRLINGETTRTLPILAYMLHEYGKSWPEAIRVKFKNLKEVIPKSNGILGNGGPDVAVARMLLGESLNDTALLTMGVDEIRVVATETFAHGGREMNAPLYSVEHWPNLIFGLALKHPQGRDFSRIILEFELLVQAHLTLQGGGPIPPQSRDYSGGNSDTVSLLAPFLWGLLGDPKISTTLTDATSGYAIGAALRYDLPPTLREIFLNKGSGYDFWTRAPVFSNFSQNVFYEFGELYSRNPDSIPTRRINPWHAYILPGGAGGFGFSYGVQFHTPEVTSGAYVRSADNRFAILHQCQPLVENDTDDSGKELPGLSASLSPSPDFIGELYDFERMLVGRTAISLWDPRPHGNVKRGANMTLASLPKWEKFGGESLNQGGWRIGRVGATYVAYYPFAELAPKEVNNPISNNIRLELPGRSGFIIEMATTSEFPTIAAYAANLATRKVVFTASPLAVEVNTYQPGQTTTSRMRLEYRPEARFINGVKQDIAVLDHGLIDSPWVKTDRDTHRVTLQRGCLPKTIYDWKLGSVTDLPAMDSCANTPKAPAGFAVN